MNIFVPEFWENDKQTLKDKLKALKQQFIENFSLPKETDKEYGILQEILWDNFEKYKKHWTITSINRAEELREIGMWIRPTDYKYMKYRTTNKIERLKTRINEKKLWRNITIRKPYWQWEETIEITPKCYYLFRW